MSFDWPAALIGLAFAPLLALAYVCQQLRRRRYSVRYSSALLVRDALGPARRIRRHVPAVLYILAIAALATAMARPTAVVPSPQASGTIMLVIDSSQSMASTDVRPTRIDAAKDAVRDFVAKQPKGVKVGVVAFAGGASLITPPTEDRKQILFSINFITLGRGTNIGEGLQVALDTLVPPNPAVTDVRQRPGIQAPGVQPAQGLQPAPGVQPAPTRQKVENPAAAMIILLSDGASTTGPPPLEVADEVAAAGIKVHTVGVGSNQATGGYFQRGGSMRMDEATLRGIADITGGDYFSADNAKALGEVYGKLARQRTLVEEETELTFVAAAVGMLFMVSAAFLGAMWSSKLP